MPTGLDFVSVRLHARRSRLAEGDRLDALCRIRAIPELARAIFGDAAIQTAVELQRRMVADEIRETVEICRRLEGPPERYLDWLCVRFQVENLKVLARGFVNRTPVKDLRPHLMPMPAEYSLNEAALAGAESLEDFARQIPHKLVAKAVRGIAGIYEEQPRPFYIEAALDRGYFLEAMERAAGLSEEDRETVMPLLVQEADVFHMMLVARGKFQYGLKPEVLIKFHIRGTGIVQAQLQDMLSAPDIAAVAAEASGPAFDAHAHDAGAPAGGGITDPGVLETLALNRYLRLADSMFRRSHIGLGAVVAYTSIRRVELTNLITLSEGIRVGAAPEAIRQRLVPRTDLSGMPAHMGYVDVTRREARRV
jgi:vacuolar-type H+-ATPase subunit C/Vma6